MGGWGEKELFSQLAIQQTKMFLGYLRNEDETGKMLTSELEFTQLISGWTYPILHQQTPLFFLKWTPDMWITNFKRILHNLDGHVRINNS